ncbi:winged helix-turn-helix domain-containing protein [Sulfurospirillum halorespirans]|uniref:Putative transcriptional regulator n=1 Tax=Sulfurospirillum halorespirans DSM 13726 TaxID=1193502 RepID=A0A1D7TMB2_9BACT|nr:winged helix-turn-helix domain-containing protein [Sulfurospirillum halorespirans]AOO66128.1 putative transcriptional regulator [Sulfurospirillum halorespirans DSM 13726]
MVNLLLLEPDQDFANRIIEGLNSTRTKFNVLHIHNMQEVYSHKSHFNTIALFILNLANPLDVRIELFIRENGGYNAPILLLLEKALVSFELFRTLHYIDRYHDITIKDSLIEPVVHRIFKLCNIWNDDIFFISKSIYFDFKNSLFVFNESLIKLGKKETLLLKLLCIKSPHYVTHNEIAHFVYQDELTNNEKIRALIKIIRKKLPINLIESVKFHGYKIRGDLTILTSLNEYNTKCLTKLRFDD